MPHCYYLGVCGGIASTDYRVLTMGYDRAVVHDYGAYGNLPGFGGLTGFRERDPHRFEVGDHGEHGTANLRGRNHSVM